MAPKCLTAEIVTDATNTIARVVHVSQSSSIRIKPRERILKVGAGTKTL